MNCLYFEGRSKKKTERERERESEREREREKERQTGNICKGIPDIEFEQDWSVG